MKTTKCDTIAKRTATSALNKKFRALCDGAEVDHTEVADALGLSRRAAWGLYYGRYESAISFDTAAAIADYFGISLDDLRK